MNKIIRSSRMVICFSIGLIFFFSCSQLALDGGSGSTTTNGAITGKFLDSTGNPAAHVVVRLLPANYNPVKDAQLPDSMIDTTSDSGIYRFSMPEKNTYNIQAQQNVGGQSVLVTGVSVVNTKDVNIETWPLQRSGALRVVLPDSMSATDAYIYIPGTTCFALPGSGGFCIPGIPAGSVLSVNYARISASKFTVVKTGVTISSGDTASIIGNNYLAYSKKLYLNTSATGANVAGNVYGFPLLVRLDNTMFNFSQARKNGEDIRFMKVGGEPLAFEIEDWDSAAGIAAVWVHVDTVYGNNATQQFIMCWGSSDVTGVSNGAAVFDTSNGFIGVWHMNEDPSAGTAAIKDHTVNAFSATPFGSMTSANSVNGMVGKGLRFNGTSDYLSAGNVSLSAKYSVGLWVLLDTLGDYRRILYKGSSYTLWYDKDEVSLRMEHMSNGSRWYGLPQDGGALVPMTTGAWYYITATFDGTILRLYTNGIEASSSNAISVVAGTSSEPLFIGISDGTSFVKGIMDEIRIESVARSADWVKLCYMNQRVDDLLVEFVK